MQSFKTNTLGELLIQAPWNTAARENVKIILNQLAPGGNSHRCWRWGWSCLGSLWLGILEPGLERKEGIMSGCKERHFGFWAIILVKLC